MSAMEERRDNLYQRLENGYQKIDRALAEGKDIAALEDFWLELLNEYERVCDELSQAGRELPGMPVRRFE